MTFLGSLHDFPCRNDPCICHPVFVLMSDTEERAEGYNSMTEVESAHSRIVNGVPVVLNPLPGRRSASSRLSR